MTDTHDEPHPLDRDDDQLELPVRSKRSPTAKSGTDKTSLRLMRGCQSTLVGSGLVAFLAQVAATNAAPNSPMENIGFTTSRIAMMVMLAAFVGVLIAFRLKQIASLRLLPGGSAKIMRNTFATLIIANLAVVIAYWCMYAVSGVSMGIIVILMTSLQVITSALLVNMIVFHSGHLRAFAIGALVPTSSLVYLAPQLMMLGFYRGGMGGGMGGSSSAFSIAVLATLQSACGLVSAAYVLAIQSSRTPADTSAAPGNQNTDKQNAAPVDITSPPAPSTSPTTPHDNTAQDPGPS